MLSFFLASTSPGEAGKWVKCSLRLRSPDGRRLDGRKQVTKDQARLLVEGRTCDEVRSPTGILRYIKMRRAPSLKKFADILTSDTSP